MGDSSTELCNMNVEWGHVMLDLQLEWKGGPQETRVWLHVYSPDGSDSTCVALRLEHLEKLKMEIQKAIEKVKKEEQHASEREKGLWDNA